MSDTVKLSDIRPGQQGVITKVGEHCHHNEFAVEVERRLIEMGLVEGARIELLHQGVFGRDPIAVKVDDMRVALRRREAASIEVKLEDAG